MVILKTVSDSFLKEIEKPSWYPVRRIYLLDATGVEVEITDRVARIDRLLWQIEQQYRINEFIGSNCRIDVKNENEEFDLDNPANFFVATLNRIQDGYKTPVKIKCGYTLLNGSEELLEMFYGLIIDSDVSTDDDIVSFDVQCISRVLMDAGTDDVGNQWTDQQIYGGSVHCYLDGAIGLAEKSIAVKNVPSGQFPSGFPPTGYVLIGNEKIHYSQLDTASFEGCIRGVFDTPVESHADNSLVEILLFSGEETDNRKFQFLVPPISRNSISAISSSDGNISLVEERNLLAVAAPNIKTTGWVDYEQGILELAGEPTDPTSLIATYKSAYRQLSYHAIVKKLLTNEDLDTALVEDAVLYDYLARRVPTSYGQITHADDSGTPTLLKLNASINAICVGKADDLLYLGVENHIIQWDGEQFNLIASLPGTDDTIVRLASHSNGKFYGVYGDKFAYSEKIVFEYDGSFTDIATIAEYIDPRPVFGYYGGQWRNFSVDETNGVVWFLYDDGSTRGIAKVNFDGTGLTKYSLPAKIDVAPYFNARWMDFVDIGNTIEFFYSHSVSEDLYYDTLTKATGVWSANGVISMPYTALSPVDIVYHPTEDRIYLNAVSTYGYLISVPRGSTVKTQLLEYDWHAIGHRGRICGMVYYPHDDYIYGIRGDENARGEEAGTSGDSATGHIYRIKNNVAEDMGNHSERLDFSGFILGSSAVMAYRESDDALFFVSTDYDMQDDPNYGYQLFRHSTQLATIIQLVDIDGRKAWDVLSELALLVNYELGVSGEGKVFWRRRHSGVTYLNGNHNAGVITINTTGGNNMDDFDTAGMIEIGTEVIYHIGKTTNSFTGCTRGYKKSTAAAHNDGDAIIEIHQVLQNQLLEKNLKYVKKLPNWDEIFNYIVVPYGDLKIQFDYALANEVFSGSSEDKYGRRTMTIANQFLTNRDALIAMACGWRYYDMYNQRTSLLEIETKWQPQLDLGDVVSVKQEARVILDYQPSRIHRIELILENFVTRLLARFKVNPYLKYLPS